MILVDTSIWIDFLRGAASAAPLSSLLVEGEAVAHPWVVGELSLGRLGPRRSAILADLERLPAAPVATDAELRRFVEDRGLAGSGIGWVDAGLLASALLAGARLWTSDRRLRAAGRALRVC